MTYVFFTSLVLFFFFISFFFFKQKTAYEIMPSLVGSEMCIRDRQAPSRSLAATDEISVDFFSSGYLDVSVLPVCLTYLWIQ